jgi:ATP-dependent DNA helicase RecG
MKLADLHALVAAGESPTLELKKSTAEKVRTCRTLCAFANARGGQLLFGVTPAGKIIGQRVSDHTLEELAQEFQGFEPPLFPEIERIPVTAAQEVISLRVEIPMLRPVSFRGVPYERVLNTTRVMPRASYQRLMLESLHATDRWETQPAQGWAIDKLDTKEITVTLEESIRRGRSDDPGTRDPLAILRGFGLLTAEEQLTRAAVALFCQGDIPQPDFPQLLLRLARFTRKTAAAARIQALEPTDGQDVLPARSHRSMGARHPQDCRTDESRRPGTALCGIRGRLRHANLSATRQK